MIKNYVEVMYKIFKIILIFKIEKKCYRYLFKTRLEKKVKFLQCFKKDVVPP